MKYETAASEWYYINFDGSLNKVVQKYEMDILIRFWHNISNLVQVRYWNSMFLGHSTIAVLIKNFNDGLTGTDPSKNLQI